MTNRDSLLITAEDLEARLRAEHDLPAEAPRTRLLDVRWTLPQPDGRAAFAEGHLPGAVYVDLDTELSEKRTPQDGRHPLPSPERLQRAARSWGIREQDEVVAYDGGGNYASARVWWLLRDAGFERVRLLDGALPAWVAAGFPLETGARTVQPGDVELGSGHLPRLELDAVASFVSAGGALLDARAPERYQGLEEPIDPRAGHIPGAVNRPVTGFWDEDGRLPSAEQLATLAGEPLADPAVPVAVYCGSGVSAAQVVLALASLGVEAALYPASWSGWSNDAARPVATGPAS